MDYVYLVWIYYHDALKDVDSVHEDVKTATGRAVEINNAMDGRRARIEERRLVQRPKPPRKGGLIATWLRRP